MASKQALDIAGYVERVTNLLNKVMIDPLHLKIPEEYADLELTGPQFQGMLFILQHPGSSVGDIAEGLAISHPAAVKMVDRLQKKGLVLRVENATDRRISEIALTEFGRQVAEKIQGKRAETVWRALGRMNQQEIDSLVRGLEALLVSALEDEECVEAVCLRCGSSHYGCCVVNRTHVAITGSGIEKT